MGVISAGLLMCRIEKNRLEFFLVHPGGPFFKNKNEGVWSIPKGISEPDEDALETAQREFFEETGIKPTPPFHPLGSIKLKSGKTVYAWSFMGTWNAEDKIVSNIFQLEWPPRSKKFIDIPEVDRAEWMPYDKAIKMIHPHQAPFIESAVKIYLH